MSTMLSTHERSRATESGTPNLASVPGQSGKRHTHLRDAFLGMASEITRPESVRWYFDDAARGRPLNELGPFPKCADACLKDGASLTAVSGPLHAELARLREICGQHGAPLTDALLVEAKEEGDMIIAERELSFCIQNPSRSCLEKYVKEASEYRDALDVAITSARDAIQKAAK